MSLKCRCKEPDWKLDYPAFESEVISDPLRIYVCQICGNARSEGSHTKLHSELTGQVHEHHLQMVMVGQYPGREQ